MGHYFGLARAHGPLQKIRSPVTRALAFSMLLASRFGWDPLQEWGWSAKRPPWCTRIILRFRIRQHFAVDTEAASVQQNREDRFFLEKYGRYNNRITLALTLNPGWTPQSYHKKIPKSSKDNYNAIILLISCRFNYPFMCSIPKTRINFGRFKLGSGCDVKYKCYWI